MRLCRPACPGTSRLAVACQVMLPFRRDSLSATDPVIAVKSSAALSASIDRHHQLFARGPVEDDAGGTFAQGLSRQLRPGGRCKRLQCTRSAHRTGDRARWRRVSRKPDAGEVRHIR